MKIEEIRALKNDEIHNEMERARRKLFELRSQAVSEKLEDPTQVAKARRGIARMLTVLNERGEANIDQTQARLSAEAARK